MSPVTFDDALNPERDFCVTGAVDPVVAFFDDQLHMYRMERDTALQFTIERIAGVGQRDGRVRQALQRVFYH